MKPRPSPTLRLIPHRFRYTDAQLGALRVPVRHAAPDGPSLELRFVRLPSHSPAPGPPIVFLTGGPGLSGVRSGEGRLFPLFDALRAGADVILFDQRACVPGAKLREWTAPPVVFPTGDVVTRAGYLRVIRESVRADAAYLKQQGVPADALNTRESADDIAVIAHALYGNNVRVALLGWSYGSHLAMAVIKRHESMVASAVLAAPEGPDHTLKRPLRIQEHLERLAARSQMDVCGMLGRVLQRMAESPVHVDMVDEPGDSASVTLGRFDLEWLMSESLADPRVLRRLPAWLARMDQGDFSVIGTERLLGGAWQSLRDELPRSVGRYCMDCASGATAERRALINHEAGTTLLGATIDFPLPDICDAVGCPDLGDEFRTAPKSNVPVLFVTGTLDCRTPAKNVEDLAPGLPNHQHLVVEDAGHGDLLLSSRVQGAIARFLRGEPLDELRVATDAPFTFE